MKGRKCRFFWKMSASFLQADFFYGGGAGDVWFERGGRGLTGEAPSEGGCAKGCEHRVTGCEKVVDKMFLNVRILKSRV